MTEVIQQRISGLDTVRCLMNYMIVLLHAWAAYQYVDCTTWEFYGWSFMCSHFCGMAMPTFFLLSGYLMFRNFSFATWSQKMTRRFRRLFIPYVAWNTTFVVVYIVFANLVPRFKDRVDLYSLYSVWGCVSKIVSFTVPPIDGPLWFLRALLILSLLSPILRMAMRKYSGLVVLTLCFLWIGGEFSLGVHKLLQMTVPSYAIFCYALGGVLAEKGRDLMSMFRSIKWFGVGFLACVMRAIILIPYSIVPETPSQANALIAQYLVILEAPAMISLVQCIKPGGVVQGRVFSFLKDMSFFAYGGHFLICSSYLHLIAPRLYFMHTFKFTTLVFVFVGLGIPTLCLMYYIGKRLFPRAIKLWDGTL